MENTEQKWAARFFTLWTGQALSLLGSQLVQFAIIWYLTQKTNSATTLAIASMMGLLPQVLFSPFIGTWVDRTNRRFILIVADSTVAAATVALAVLFALGIVQVWHIYLVLFIRSLAGGFHQSAFSASTVLLVPKDQLARVQGFNQALGGGLNIIAAPLGAFLLSVLPMQGILAIDISTAIIAVTIVIFTHIPQPERGEAKPSTFWQDFTAGFKYIAAWRGLVMILTMAMIINFFFSAVEPLTPLLITKHFKGNAAQLGWWLSLFSVGVLSGGLFLGIWGGFKRKIITAQSGLIVMGLLAVAIGFLPSNMLWLGMIVNLLFGLTQPIVNGSFGATLQAVVTPDMQGRVFSFIFSAAMLVSPIALMISGPFADRFGIQVMFLIAGVCCAVMGVGGFFVPAIMGIEEEAKTMAAGSQAEPA